jgi:hypothetical protein
LRHSQYDINAGRKYLLMLIEANIFEEQQQTIQDFGTIQPVSIAPAVDMIWEFRTSGLLI